MIRFRSVVLTVATCGIFGLVITARILPPDKRADLDLEVAKGLIDLLLVTVVGGGITELLKERDLQRAKSDKEADYRSRVRRAVTQAYLKSKRSRRCLRAEATKIKPGHYAAIALRSYDFHMRVVNDAQLELERLVRELRVTSPQPKWLDDVTPCLKSMEGYLRGLVTEYEDSYGGELSSQSLSFEVLPRLNDFLGSFEGSQFQKAFAYAHDKFLSVMGKAEPRTPTRSKRRPT